MQPLMHILQIALFFHFLAYCALQKSNMGSREQYKVSQISSLICDEGSSTNYVDHFLGLFFTPPPYVNQFTTIIFPLLVCRWPLITFFFFLWFVCNFFFWILYAELTIVYTEMLICGLSSEVKYSQINFSSHFSIDHIFLHGSKR